MVDVIFKKNILSIERQDDCIIAYNENLICPEKITKLTKNTNYLSINTNYPILATKIIGFYCQT